MKIKKSHIESVILIFILIFPSYLFGVAGFGLFMGFFVAIIFPAYLLLKNFNIEKDEAIFFSFFIGIVFVPLVLWYLDRLFASLVVSLIVTSVLFYVSSFVVHLVKRKELVK